LKEQINHVLTDLAATDGKSTHNLDCRLMLPQLIFIPRIGLQVLFHDPHFNKFNYLHYISIGIRKKNFSLKPFFLAEN